MSQTDDKGYKVHKSEAEWRKQPIHSDYDAKLAVAYNVVQI